MNNQNIFQPNRHTKSPKHIWITIISTALTAIIVGGGVYAWQRSSLRAIEQSLQRQITDLQNQINTSETAINKPGWAITTNQQLGIRFEHPADATVSSVTQRRTSDGTTINELVVIPAGTDSTRVHFFTTNVPIDQAKNIKIYRANIENSEFVSAMVDGYVGTQRIDYYLHNDCTNELTVVEKNGVVYGSHIILCPTHPQGYDRIRKDIVDSLDFLQ